jgi:hypothetical protein
MTTIDITKFGRPHPRNPKDIYFVDLNHGKETAEKSGFNAAILAGPVNVVLMPGISEFGYPYRRKVPDSFIRGFFSPAMRKIGIDEFLKRVKINGYGLDDKVYCDLFQASVQSIVQAEVKRRVRVSKEKARETNGVWGKMTFLMVPGISTVMKLAKDWTFRLHKECRNNDMLGLFGKSSTWKDSGEVAGDVTIKAGAELSVNRVYIRQGADEFSSYTFFLKKGATVEMDGKIVVTNGKGKVRFWAKLSDVNKMAVLIDTNTLADN